MSFPGAFPQPQPYYANIPEGYSLYNSQQYQQMQNPNYPQQTYSPHTSQYPPEAYLNPYFHPHFMNPQFQSSIRRPPMRNHPYDDQRNKKQNNAGIRCEPCQKRFHQLSQYQEHVMAHRKCPHCSFSAHKTLIEPHILQYHPPAPKVSSESPEEIEKWIRERKEKFPTRQRSQLKIQQKQNENKKIENISNETSQIPSSSNPTSTKESQKDCESGEEENEEGQVNETKKPTKRKIYCKYYQKGKCKNSESCPFVHEKRPPKQQIIQKQKRTNLLRVLMDTQDVEAEKQFMIDNFDQIIESNL